MISRKNGLQQSNIFAAFLAYYVFLALLSFLVDVLGIGISIEVGMGLFIVLAVFILLLAIALLLLLAQLFVYIFTGSKAPWPDLFTCVLLIPFLCAIVVSIVSTLLSSLVGSELPLFLEQIAVAVSASYFSSLVLVRQKRSGKTSSSLKSSSDQERTDVEDRGQSAKDTEDTQESEKSDSDSRL